MKNCLNILRVAIPAVKSAAQSLLNPGAAIHENHECRVEELKQQRVYRKVNVS